MNFPHPFTPDMITRAGRMMTAGRCKVTMTYPSGEHITILFQAVADNRDRSAFPKENKNWVDCQLADASHLFAEVPTPSGKWNDKLGTYYPKSRDGRWYDADNADPTRVRAAFLCAMWLEGQKVPDDFKFVEAAECGAFGCGLELTDPVSVARGIGPTCYGKLTGSVHAKKWSQVEQPQLDETVTADEDTVPASLERLRTAGLIDQTDRNPDGSVKVAHAHRYHETQEPEIPYEDLGLPSAAENAAYGLLKGMSEEQLRTAQEWVEMQIEKVVKMRKELVAEAREAEDPIGDDVGEAQDMLNNNYRDQSFMGR